jgi:RHS repeat-associated protein
MPNLGLTPQSVASAPTTFPSSQFPNNQWIGGAGAAYDAAGNQTQWAGSSGTFTYDGENRLLSANVLNEGTVTFAYDAEGRRVQKTSAQGTTTYIHDAMGRLAAEYSTQAPTATGTQYLTADHLGSTRLVTDGTGNVVRCIDYLPFGEEIPSRENGRSGCYESLGNAILPQYPAPPDVESAKFTGKERDAETGLDFFGARYFSGAQGRFTTPDWSDRPEPIPYVDLENPQTLNLYTYSHNNPLRWNDPDGHCTADGETHGWLWCAAHSIGLTQTVKEQAADARASLSQAHGFTINGQAPADIAKNGTDQQVIAANRAADKFLLGVAQEALSELICPKGVTCGVIPIGPGDAGIPLKSLGTVTRVETALDNIAKGAQQYSRDGITFANREGLLPAQALGYYKEYTVPPAAGVADRGAERLIVGKAGEVFYTPDHYKSFVRIK